MADHGPTDPGKTTEKDPFVGQVLGGRYKIVRRLGGGGMGSVYEGVHTVIGKRVAIKMLHAELASRTDLVARFVNEARAAATLGHPNIIDATDVGATPEGAPFLVLEFLEGRDLDQTIREGGPLAVARAVGIMKQVGSALGAAHARGIVHRDMKPENVFLVKRDDGQDFVKVLDFGVSKFTQDGQAAMTRAGATLGTPAYMAPEQLMDSSQADARADIYAAGVMLYQMLSGAQPFQAESYAALLMAVFTQPTPRLDSVRADLPTALLDVVSKAMARAREDRYPTMAAFIEALEPFGDYREGGARTLKQGSGARSSPPAALVIPAQSSSIMDTQDRHSTEPVGSPEGPGHAAMERRCPSCNARIGREAECPECGHALEDPRLGQVVAGRFRIDKLLGVGGVGRVYVGTHVALKEPVAIKFLLAEWCERNEFRTRFRREAVTLARLRHPGIVSVHDYGEHGGELYMVMELVRGRPLRDVVPADHTLPPLRALGLIDLLAEVVAFAHGEGIVHRDLKPENVMVLELGEKTDKLKVLDFGLALETTTAPAERLTATHAVHGTILYMSPEQCRGRDVGPPTDVYAMGVMLYEMLCGTGPFEAASFSEMMVQQMFMEPPALADRGLRPTVPPAIETLVRAMLAKAPEARPTAVQVREQIALVLRGEDAVTQAQRAAQAKALDALSSRADRGIATGLPSASAASGKGVSGAVALWDLDPPRAQALANQFAVNGILSVPCAGDAAPMATVNGHTLKAILLPWNAAGQRHIEALRARPDLAKLPIIIVDASAVDDTPAIIRAGASDVTFAGAPPDTICRQVVKLMRRVK